MTSGKADLGSAERLDDTLVEVTGPDGAPAVACRHCAEILGGTGESELSVAVHEGPSTGAGRLVATRTG